ncbi:MAG TPA: MBL fold metallo-hydrolase [Rhabdochlamydiaceae bacterium]|nr:MBL fold metallo-hydrolase [Rhabdochlamydiaceae bacterium]
MARYVNPHKSDSKRKFWHFLLWRLGYYDDKRRGPLDPNFVFPRFVSEYDPNKPYVTWINHSSFLISLNGLQFLTDPIWNERPSPVAFCGPKRKHLPGIKLEELPKIDYVLISHNHYDHLDKPTVKRLAHLFPHIYWIVPQGVKQWFLKEKIFKVVELSWWEDSSLSPHLKITAVPAQHFSGRRGYDLNKTLWLGWVVEDFQLGKRFYFVGDTGYNTHDFKKIGETFGSFDLSLIPIGSYVPRRFMSPVHIEPKDAVRIHQEVGSKLSIGMHWRTFRLSDEPMHQPPYDLYLALKQNKIEPSQFRIIEPGVKLNW